ncbi:MAG: hypothetical protein JNL82_28500 [Myxococcales bacterium]|nr:hypothetical protein [Myxococcales bacterium]
MKLLIGSACPARPVPADSPSSTPGATRPARPVLSASRVVGLAALCVALVACEREPLAPVDASADAPACPGDSRAFVHRALPAIQARRPYGVRELRLLADIVDQLDAAGADGRRLLAEGLARGPLYERRLAHFLVDHLGVIRSGHRHLPRCWGPRTAAGADRELAAWLRDHDPKDSPPIPGWTMSDVLASSVALDDPRPLLRAALVARMKAPIEGANVKPTDLEAARRTNFATSFEARWLGRRRECLTCHADDASVTDAADPASDRFWPLAPGLDAAVFGELPPADASLDAAFRVFGFVDGVETTLAPWGVDPACIRVADGRGADILDDPGHLAGPLPRRPNLLDVDDRLRRGFAALAAEGLPGAADDPTRALATMVAARLADGLWTDLTGAPLTLAHGHPRNPAAREALADLTAALVDDEWSLRALVVAAVTHPAADVAAPDACDAALPPVLDPWSPDNDAADLVHRPGPWTLLDSAHTALEWPLARPFPAPYGYPDEPLLVRLGVAIDEVELGLRSSELVGQLAWEASYAEGVDPGLGDAAADPDWISRLLAAAAATPDATLADLAIAIADRLVGEPDLPRSTADALAALLATPLATPLAELAPAAREQLARRLAGAFLTTPQFLLHGLAPAHQHGSPRIVTPDATTRALCESHRDLLPPPWRIECTDLGARVTRRE